MEQREAPRISVVWRAVVIIAGQAPLQCKTINVSASGCALLCPEQLAVGASYPLAIEAPAAPGSPQKVYIEANCIILHSILIGQVGQFRLGIRFTEISSAHKGLIKTWIDSRGQ